MSQLGLPSAQYSNQLNQINANQANAVSAASRSANPGAAISSIQGQTNTATNNLNAEDAQARQTNQRYYIDVNGQLAGQKLAQQQANVFDPYTQHYNEMQADKGAGLQNINTGLQDISSLGGYALQYGLHQGGGSQPQTFGQATGTPQIASAAPQPAIGNPQLTNTLPGYPAPGSNLNQPMYANWNLQWQ